MKRFASLFFVLSLLLSLCSCAPKTVEEPPSPSPTETAPAFVPVAPEEPSPWLEDYDYFWTTVEENYPLYAAAERITGKDLSSVKEEYRVLAGKAKSAEELYDVLKGCTGEFQGTGHFTLYNEDWYRSMMDWGRGLSTPKEQYLYHQIDNPVSRAFYRYEETEQEEGETSAEEQEEPASENLIFKEFPDEGAVYVEILAMDTTYFDEERAALEAFFARAQAEGYRHCIVDIRRNGGGTDYYGTIAIIEPNITKTLSSTHYALVRGGDAALDYFKTVEDWLPLRPIEKLRVERLPALEQDDLALATHFYQDNMMAYPARNQTGPLFSGKFWLLVGPEVYSASEGFAAFCKDTGFATLVGEGTGGDGIGIDPYLFALPNSGICLRFSAENGLNSDGSCSEEYGTQPDIPNAPGMDALETCLAAIREENGGK